MRNKNKTIIKIMIKWERALTEMIKKKRYNKKRIMDFKIRISIILKQKVNHQKWNNKFLN